MTGMDMKRGEEKRERDKERGKEGSLNMKRMKRKKNQCLQLRFCLSLWLYLILSFFRSISPLWLICIRGRVAVLFQINDSTV